MIFIFPQLVFNTLTERHATIILLIRNLVIGIQASQGLSSAQISLAASALLVAMLLGFQDCWRGKEAWCIGMRAKIRQDSAEKLQS